MMKSLVAYYSRTGMTKKVGGTIANILNSDIEEVVSVKERKGILGYLLSGKEGMKKVPAEIKESIKNPSDYDLVIIGTPIWGFNMSGPIRAYLMKKKFKDVAFFCTEGGSGGEKAFLDMEKICGKKPKAILELKTLEVKQGKYDDKVRAFVDKVKNQNNV